MLKTVIYNTGAQIVGKAVTASSTLLITILIGNALGEVGYGDFTKIFTFVGYFYTLADFGLNTIYIKKTTPASAIPLLKSLMGLRLIVAIFFAAAAVIVSFALPYFPNQNIGFSPIVKIGIAIASLTIVTQALFTTANGYFQKILRYDFSTIAAVAGTALILLGTFLINLLKIGLLGYTSVYIVGSFAFVFVAYYLIFAKTQKIILPLVSLADFKNLISPAWPVGFALVLNLIYFRADIFILANTRQATEVGLYGLAYQFFEASLAIPIFFANSLYPLLTEIYLKNKEEFKRQIAFWLKLLAIFGLFLAIFLILVAGLIPLFFRGHFTGSIIALQILASGLPFFFISALLWHLLIITDRQKYLIYTYGTGAVFNVAANLLFIPVFGYLAASIITVISEGLVMILLFLFIRFLKP